MRLFKTYVQVFTLRSAGARLYAASLGFTWKDGATLKEVQEQVPRLAPSQLCQKGDKPHYKELNFVLYKANAGCLSEVISVFRPLRGCSKARRCISKPPEDYYMSSILSSGMVTDLFPRALLLAQWLYISD